MDITDIIKNSLGYPLTNTKNFLFLGLLILLASLYTILVSAKIESIILGLLLLLTLIIIIFRYGYNIRILESSINGSDTLPDFGNWKRMFIDGLKVLLVDIVYIIPMIILLFILIIIITVASISTGNVEGSGIFAIMIIFGIAGLYMLFVYPIILFALANMANNQKNISYAFKFGEIKNQISDLGLGNFIVWYIITGIIYVAVLGIGLGITSIFGLVHVKFIGQIINALLIGPFAAIFLYRSTSLLYKSSLELMEEEPESIEDPNI